MAIWWCPGICTGKAQPDRLSADAETAVFRLVQEALTNTRKHAGEGAKATIDEFWSNDVLSITVSDNGRGAASAADGHKPDTDWLVCMNALSRWVAACRPAQGRMVALLWRLRFRSPCRPTVWHRYGGSGANRYLAYTRIDGSGAPKVLDQGDTRESNWVVDLRSGPSGTIF